MAFQRAKAWQGIGPLTAAAYRLLSVLLLGGLLAACGSSGYDGPVPTTESGQKVGKPYRIGGIWYYPEVDDNYDETGMASWYGPQFHGRPTANGERFDMNRLSAAHRTLPLPSVVQVTNLDNGRSLKVRVNDRGPFAKGRIIDLSRRAAQLLGFEKQGVARVRVQLVRTDGSIARTGDGGKATVARRVDTDRVMGPLYVQLGSFSDYQNARSLMSRLRDLDDVHIQSVTVAGRSVYRLRVGPFDDRREAERILDVVYDRGFYEARIFTERLG